MTPGHNYFTVLKAEKGFEKKEKCNLFNQQKQVCAFQTICGAPTIGGGSARPRGGGGWSQRSQISLPSHPECTKTVQKQPVYHTY